MRDLFQFIDFLIHIVDSLTWFTDYFGEGCNYKIVGIDKGPNSKE